MTRYYNPRLARFLRPDPLSGSLGDPQTLNRYAYTRNDPVNNIDPSGMVSVPHAGGGGGIDWGFLLNISLGLVGANGGFGSNWNEFAFVGSQIGIAPLYHSDDPNFPFGNYDSDQLQSLVRDGVIQLLGWAPVYGDLLFDAAGGGGGNPGDPTKSNVHHVAAQSDCLLANGVRQITYSLENAQGNSLSGYYVTEYIVDRATGQPNSSFTSGDNRNGPGTSSGKADGAFLDLIGGLGSFDVLQTFTVSTSAPGQQGTNIPVSIVDNQDNAYGTNGIFVQNGAVYVNGTSAQKRCN